jgi:hypothetical protein
MPKVAKHAAPVLDESRARPSGERPKNYRTNSSIKLNAVEIEQAISALAEQPSDVQEFCHHSA